MSTAVCGDALSARHLMSWMPVGVLRANERAHAPPRRASLPQVQRSGVWSAVRGVK